MEFVIALLGLVILVLAGDSLVRGAVNVSLRLGVPALIVSLTIVAIGTSAPELLIAINAVLEHAPGLAIGNVVGSNTANVLLVLGLPALLAGLKTSEIDTRQGFVQMLAATALFVAIALLQPITWVHGVILFGVYCAILGHAAHKARTHRREVAAAFDDLDEVEGADPDMPWWRIGLYLVMGLIGLPLGAELLVDASTEIARAYNISETVIGLTLVAIGTSLPELATTIAAAYRRQADVAIGNVIGSNIANLLAIIGIASFFGDIPVARAVMQFDLWVMVGASVLLVPFVFWRINITRLWGGVLTTLYAVYLIIVLI